MKANKFKVISLHPWTGGCDQKCSFCYKDKKPKKTNKDPVFWYKLIPYLRRFTKQVAVGADGEPFMDSKFIANFANLCKKSGLICNVTTNGRKLMKMSTTELQETLKDITMVSISYDSEKIKNKKDNANYFELVKRIKKSTNTQVGANLLIESKYFKNGGMSFLNLVGFMFKIGVDRVFALYPKNFKSVDILLHKQVFQYASLKYEHFYQDDLGIKIIEENSYTNWKTPCHYGKSLISIDSCGTITGCSYDKSSDSLLKLNKPKDLLKIKNLKIKERKSCPYLKI